MFKLFVLNFLPLLVLLSCGNDDNENAESKDPVSTDISPVGSFTVEATSNENELLVKWVNPSNRDLDKVELSYKDLAYTQSKVTDITPKLVLLPAVSDAESQYLLKVPCFSNYEVTAVAISKSGKRSAPKSRIIKPFYEEVKLPAMLDRAHSYMTSVIGYYFGKSSRSCWRANYPYNGGAYWDGDALVWGQGGGLSAFVAIREAAKESEIESVYNAMDNMMFEGIQHFCQLDHNILAYSVYPAPGNDRLYDDNAWIGLDMVDWYVKTKEMRYLTQANVVWRYLIDHGWDETCGGGIHWKELNTPSTSKHTCSTGPTAVLGCKLYLATQKQEYLDWAVKCYNYLLDQLQDKSDHLFYDHIRFNEANPNLPGEIAKDKYSYNSGQPLQAACLLYKITGEQKYLDEAHAIAESCHKKWFMPYRSKELNLSFNILAPGHAWFNTIMCRGFFELYSIDNDRKYINDIEKSMLHAWNSSCHQSNNLLNDDDLRGGTSMNNWDILHQGALIELYARLAVLEREKNNS